MDQNIKVEEEQRVEMEQVDGSAADTDNVVNLRKSMWRVFGKQIPREEIVYFCQISVVLVVVVASIYNLSVGEKEQSELWTALLSSCLVYIMPNPRLKSS